MLYESKEIGPVPCTSANLVLDMHICLQNPLQKSIKMAYGIKRNMFALQWQNDIENEIGERWNELIPLVKKKWTIYKCVMILSCILFFAIPLILYFCVNFNMTNFQRLLIVICIAILFAIIGAISAWFWSIGVSNKFRKELVCDILVNYMNELKLRHKKFDFTILYPVIYYFQGKIDKHDEPEEHIYCVIRISDGIVYCNSENEPIYFTTSDLMKEIHSKYVDKNKKEQSLNSFTPRSNSNPPILHQMRKDNHKHYSILSPFKNDNTSLIQKFDFNTTTQ
eukprot:89472_1